MGALFIYDKNRKIDLDSILKIFNQKGFNQPKKFETEKYNILLYPKIRVNEQNFIQDEDGFIAAIGTIVYKKLSYSESLKALYDDLKYNNFTEDELIGTFWILCMINGNVFFVRDRSGIQNIYISADNEIISSSFLACAYSFTTPLSINKNAVTEILTTGSLIGPDTVFNEIKRVDSDEKVEIDGMKERNQDNFTFPGFCEEDFDECVDNQIAVLDSYFDSIKFLADKEGTDSGITGGHDSRLIMVLGLKHLSHISFHTHWRNKNNIEFEAAKEVCNIAGVNIKLIPVSDPLEMPTDQVEKNFENAFLFFDGLIRMHSFWTEEYNTREYREKILGENKLGLSGIGGEQYRNEERMNRQKWNLKKVIKYKILLNVCGDCFTNENELNKMIEYLENKIRNKLLLDDTKCISHLDYKRYLNEVFIPARLGVRNNAENQLSFFLSPFTDYTVSNESYKIVNKLGASYSFEESMIRKINPQVASAPSDHGFDFNKGEPLLNKIKGFIMDFIPLSIAYKYYSKRIKAKDCTAHFDSFLKRSPILKSGFEEVYKLGLPVDLNTLVSRPDLMPLVLAMGYLFFRMRNKINII